jgi:hypothetical protein
MNDFGASYTRRPGIMAGNGSKVGLSNPVSREQAHAKPITSLTGAANRWVSLALNPSYCLALLLQK